MKQVTSFFKALSRVFTVFVASALLLVTAACSNAPNAQAAISGDRGGSNPPGQEQSYKGGMNNFSDVDPRYNTSGADAKAKALRDQVDRNINEKGIDSVDQYVENYRSGTPIQERTARLGEDIKRGVENFTGDAQDATDRLGDKSGRALNNVKDNTQAAGNDFVQDTKQAVDRASGLIQNRS